MEKTSFKIFFWSLFISIFIFVGLFVFSLSTNKDEEINVGYVDNPIIFFTVENCVNKYVGLITSKNSKAIYNVIDKDYREENGINEYNVLSINKNLEGNYSFVSNAMLEDQNEKYKYYVRGYLTKEVMDDNVIDERIEYSLIVKLDVENSTYSVILSEVGDYFDAV